MNLTITKATKADALTVAKLAIQMWEDNSIEGLTEEFIELIEKDDAQIFIKFAQDKAVGFAQCQLRYDYVEGTESSPVGYLEGIFVEKEYRGQGYAKELLSECQKWAKEKGCLEFASDCELDNVTSLKFHMAMGFEEANRIICFTKKL